MALPSNVILLPHIGSTAPHDQPAGPAGGLGPVTGHFPDDYAGLLADMQAIGASFRPGTHQFHHPLHSGHSRPVVPWRRVISIPGITWLDEPETCLSWWATPQWLLDGQILICPGCGLDCT